MNLRPLFCLLVSMLLPALASAGEPHDWHVLCVTYAGTVSLIHGLTHDEAQFIHDRLLGLPATAQEKKQAKENEARQAKEWAEQENARRAKAPQCPHLKSETDWEHYWFTHDDDGCWLPGGIWKGSDISFARMGEWRSNQPSDMKSVEIFR